jgi:hypothetical protein
MKKFGIMVIALAMLVLMTGIVMADPGVNQTFETQGITMETLVDVTGSMKASADVTWKITSTVPLGSIPPAPASGVYYLSTYSEDTESDGTADIQYSKDLILESKAANGDQSNIEATKLLTFNGYNGASVTTTDNIFLDGTGNYSLTKNQAICVFAASTSTYIPAFCNRVESGSTVSGEFINMETTTNDRFIVDSADTPVELNHVVTVSPVTIVNSAGQMQTYPSVGDAEAFMEGLIMEGRGNSSGIFETIEFAESTSVSGDIYKFSKNMHYESGFRRVREA